MSSTTTPRPACRPTAARWCTSTRLTGRRTAWPWTPRAACGSPSTAATPCTATPRTAGWTRSSRSRRLRSPPAASAAPTWTSSTSPRPGRTSPTAPTLWPVPCSASAPAPAASPWAPSPGNPGPRSGHGALEPVAGHREGGGPALDGLADHRPLALGVRRGQGDGGREVAGAAFGAIRGAVVAADGAVAGGGPAAPAGPVDSGHHVAAVHRELDGRGPDARESGCHQGHGGGLAGGSALEPGRPGRSGTAAGERDRGDCHCWRDPHGRSPPGPEHSALTVVSLPRAVAAYTCARWFSGPGRAGRAPDVVRPAAAPARPAGPEPGQWGGTSRP